jgi:hypothetical protein
MLLNPKDLVRISLVSVGGKPQFDIRSRIAGVSKIELKDEDLTATSNQKSTKRLTVGLLLLSVYAYLFFEFATSLLQRQFKLSLIAAALICNTGGGFLLETVGVNAKINAGEFYSYLFVTVAVTALFYFLINIRLMRRLFGSKKAM